MPKHRAMSSLHHARGRERGFGAAGATEASTMDQAFTMAQASTGLGTTGRPGTNTSSPQRPSLGALSGVNHNNSQDITAAIRKT
jgi:hypothetical protein